MIGKKEKKNDEREKNQKKEKERKSNKSKKYGKAAYLQSRRGVISCWLTGWSFALLREERQPELSEGLQSFL